MEHFSGPRTLYRWQLGLIAASLPRRHLPHALSATGGDKRQVSGGGSGLILSAAV
jgi:hypothetical protein